MMDKLQVHPSGTYANFYSDGSAHRIHFRAALNGSVVRIRQMFYSIDGHDISIRGQFTTYTFLTEIGVILEND